MIASDSAVLVPRSIVSLNPKADDVLIANASSADGADLLGTALAVCTHLLYMMNNSEIYYGSPQVH